MFGRRAKAVIGAISTAGISLAILTIAAGPASANTITSYCEGQIHNVAVHSAGTALYCQEQYGIGEDWGYTGPVNGTLGVNSWAAIQQYLHDAGWGYNGPVNGVPGTNTYKAMQRAAAAEGYTGPINGVMGTNSWNYWAYIVEIYCNR